MRTHPKYDCIDQEPKSSRRQLVAQVETRAWCFVPLLLWLCWICPLSMAQDFDHFPAPDRQESAEEARERQLASRFLTVLRRSPRLGTALDKVYGFHVGQGTLDAFSTSIQQEAEETDDGSMWMILGMVQLQRGQDAFAADSLRKAEQFSPELALASYYLGKSLVLTGEIDEAAEAFRRCISKKPARADMLQVFKDLGRVYQRTGRNQEALEVWEELEAIFPGDTNVQEQIAAILADEGAEEAALERYANLAASLKDRFRKVEMSIRAAQLKAKLGNSEEALEDFERQLGVVNPDSWLYRDIRTRIEEVFWGSSDFDGLVDYYTNWTKDHPEDVDAMMRAARILAIQKRGPESKEWFRKAIEAAPSNVDARLALIESYAGEFQYAEAAKEMEALIEVEPNNPDYLTRWGELVMSDDETPLEQRRGRAAEIWARMLDTRGDDAVAISRVADLLRSADLTDAAIEHYRKAIQLAANEPQYREYLGEYLHQLGRKEEAVVTWKSLASDTRRTRDNLVRLSEVFSTFKYPKLALETIAEACTMKPTFGHLARYAELLRENAQYDESMAQLDRAEPLAEDRELRELLMNERLKNYVASGKLKDRVAELEQLVESDSKDDAATWRLLAVFREADRRFQPACAAIEKATDLAATDVPTWETAAGLYERTGRFGEAVSAYRKLATLDRRFLSHYLTEIAKLEMRLGNVDAALQAGEDLLASAPGNADHYRFFSDLCMQAGDTVRGLDVLRRNVRQNPNDRDAIEHLAQTLAEEFETDEAIELYWRSFDRANDVESKIPTIEALAELYLRTNRFEMFLDRLELIAREENKPRDGIFWVAAAHQAAGDLGMARQLLEQLARSDSRDTKLLQQLVDLSKVEYDFERAADYQRRLLSISPSPEGQYSLAKFLMELGEEEEAQQLFKQLAKSRKRGARSGILSTVNDLLSKGQLEAACELAEQTLRDEPENWELMAATMIALVRNDELDKAQNVAQQVFALDLDSATPTEAVKQAMARSASRRSSNLSNQYAMLGSPARTLSDLQQIKAAFGQNSDPFGYQSGRMYTPTCFGSVELIAQGVINIALEKDGKLDQHLKEQSQLALKSEDREALWESVHQYAWTSPTFVYEEVNEDSIGQQCLEKLADLEDTHAAILLLSQKYSMRQNRGSGAVAGKLKDDEVERLVELYSLAMQEEEMRQSRSYIAFWLVAELRTASREAQAQSLFDETIGDSEEPMQLVQAASVMMRPMMMSGVSKKEAKGILETAVPLLKKALKNTDNQTQSASSIGRSLAQVVPLICEFGTPEEAIELVKQAVELQGRLTAAMRPSQRSATPSNASRTYYVTYKGGNYQQVEVNFPTPSGYFSADTINMLHSLVMALKEQEQSAAVSKAVNDWVETPDEDPYLQFARLMAKASVEYWLDKPKSALKTISQADDLALGSQFVGLMRARMSYDNGDVKGALDTIENLRPSNQRMLVDRELTRLSLLLELGDLERAKRSAQKLFALRLDSDTEFKLADLMFQLGMREMGDRMMSRIRRRAGGKQDTLTQLMQRFASSGELKSAAEIARQVVRRTNPPVGSRRTSENTQHLQALQILVRAGEINGLIERHEKLVERSPKSVKLINQLSAMYEAAGRRQDAVQLRQKLAEATPNNPQRLLEVGKQLAQGGSNAKAVEMFVEAIRKSPNLLEQHYYDLRGAFQAEKAWPKLTKVLATHGAAALRNNHRIGEIISEMVQAEQGKEAGEFLEVLVTEGDWYTLSNALTSVRRRDEQLQISDKTAEKIVDRLCSASGNMPNVNYIYSISSGGLGEGTINYMTELISKKPEYSTRVKEELSKQIEDEPMVFQSTVLVLVHLSEDNVDKAQEIVDRLLEEENSDRQKAQALWAIASDFMRREKSPETVIQILESFENPADTLTFGYSGLDFTSSPMNLLVKGYEAIGEHAKAKEILVDVMKDLKIDTQQNRYNPGYGEYQYIHSMDGLARRLVEINAIAEGFMAFQKAYADVAMLERARRYYGSWESRKKSLQELIDKKLTPDVTLDLVQKATTGGSKDSQFLASPMITGDNMTDVRVRLPLESFLKSAEDDPQIAKLLSDSLSKLEPLKATEEFSMEVLVCRLIVAARIEEAEIMKSITPTLATWLESHPQPQELNSLDENEQATQELLLSVAARAFSSYGKEDEQAHADETSDEDGSNEHIDESAESRLAESLLRRSISAADLLEENSLAFGLRVQLASQVAARDKAAAKTLYMEALDELLPVTEE